MGVGVMQFLKYLDQIVETPQVNARFRLVKHRQRGVPGQDGGDFNALQLPAGQAGVHIPVDIVPGAQTNFGQIFAGPGGGEAASRREGDQVLDLDSLEAYRLLECETDTASGSLGDGKFRDILSVKKDTAAGGLFNAHDQFGQGRLASAVWPGDHDEAVIADGEIQVFDNLFLRGGRVRHLEGEVL